MKKTVCVIFGGASSEYEVSLMSSASIIRNLDTEKFDILTLGITKDGRWPVSYTHLTLPTILLV